MQTDGPEKDSLKNAFWNVRTVYNKINFDYNICYIALIKVSISTIKNGITILQKSSSSDIYIKTIRKNQTQILNLTPLNLRKRAILLRSVFNYIFAHILHRS